jgi:hypothetical protein
MKTLISAIALLVVSNIAAMAADQTLKFKLVSFYMGDKDGESHFSGVTVSPNGTIGTKDFFDKQGENGTSTGHSTYYFPDGSLVANYSTASTGTSTGGHISSANTRSFPGQAPIRARPAEAQLTGTGATRARSRTPAFLTSNWT